MESWEFNTRNLGLATVCVFCDSRPARTGRIDPAIFTAFLSLKVALRGHDIRSGKKVKKGDT